MLNNAQRRLWETKVEVRFESMVETARFETVTPFRLAMTRDPVAIESTR